METLFLDSDNNASLMIDPDSDKRKTFVTKEWYDSNDKTCSIVKGESKNGRNSHQKAKINDVFAKITVVFAEDWFFRVLRPLKVLNVEYFQAEEFCQTLL